MLFACYSVLLDKPFSHPTLFACSYLKASQFHTAATVELSYDISFFDTPSSPSSRQLQVTLLPARWSHCCECWTLRTLLTEYVGSPSAYLSERSSSCTWFWSDCPCTKARAQHHRPNSATFPETATCSKWPRWLGINLSLVLHEVKRHQDVSSCCSSTQNSRNGVFKGQFKTPILPSLLLADEEESLCWFLGHKELFLLHALVFIHARFNNSALDASL